MTDGPRPDSGPGLKLHIRMLAWTAVLIPFFALAMLSWDDGPGVASGDFAHYLLHAQAIVDGRSYTDTGYLFTEEAWAIGPRAQPPGFPMVLAPILAVAGGNLFVVRIAMLMLATAFLYCAGRYFARSADPSLGLGVTLVLGASIPIAYGSTQILSDLPFAALVWGLILLYDRDGPWGTKRILAATLVMGATLAFRTAGIAIIPAALLYSILHARQHRWRPVAPVLATAALGAIAVAAVGLSLGVVGRISSTLLNINNAPLQRIVFYRLEAAESLLYPFTGDLANDIYHVVALAIAGLGIAQWLLKRWRSYAVAFTTSYGVMLLVVPVDDGRYLWPLLPVIVFGFLNGGRILVALLRPKTTLATQRRVVLVAAGLLVISSMLFRPSDPPRGELAKVPAVQELFEHLRTAASQEDEMRVAFVKPRVLSWETRIPAMGIFNGDPDAVLTALRRNRITRVILGTHGLADRSDRAFRATVEANPEAFQLQFENEEFSVYRFAEPYG